MYKGILSNAFQILVKKKQENKQTNKQLIINKLSTIAFYSTSELIYLLYFREVKGKAVSCTSH